MISSREEFLLLARNWRNASANVGIAVVRWGNESVNPLSSAFLLKLNARVAEVDELVSNITFSVGDDGLLLFGLEGATFKFGTSEELPSELSALLKDSEEVDETFTVGLASGVVVIFLKFKEG
jgi:hypothetical protein